MTPIDFLAAELVLGHVSFIGLARDEESDPYPAPIPAMVVSSPKYPHLASCTSFWRPSWLDRIFILFGRPVRVVLGGMPGPLMLDVGWHVKGAS